MWLDPEKTSPYDFYQYWRNVDDGDVMKCLKMLTFIPLDELNKIEKWEDSRINEKKMLLARELTTLVHGKEEADMAEQAALALFSGVGDDANMPTSSIDIEQLEDGAITVIDLLVLSDYLQI